MLGKLVINVSPSCQQYALSSTTRPSSEVLQTPWASPSCHQCGPSWTFGDSIFQHIQKEHEGEWGNILDAGTGKKSLRWLLQLPSKGVWGVSASQQMVKDLQGEGASLVQSKWGEHPPMEPGQVFDTILMDYLVGSLDTVEPYSQEILLDKISEYMAPGATLYIVGNEPFPEVSSSPSGTLLVRTAKLRDAALLTAGGRPLREQPLSWYLQELREHKFTIENVSKFPTIYGKGWVKMQLKAAVAALGDQQDLWTKGWHSQIEQLGHEAEHNGDLARGLCFGMDFVITASFR